jgi:hypothetical protein
VCYQAQSTLNVQITVVVVDRGRKRLMRTERLHLIGFMLDKFSEQTNFQNGTIICSGVKWSNLGITVVSTHSSW